MQNIESQGRVAQAPAKPSRQVIRATLRQSAKSIQRVERSKGVRAVRERQA